MPSIPAMFRGDEELFLRAVRLANLVCSVTESCASRFGIQAAAAPIKSEPGTEPLFSMLKDKGYTFNVLYSDNEQLDLFLPDDVYLIYEIATVKTVWQYVGGARRQLIQRLQNPPAALSQDTLAPPVTDLMGDYVFGGGGSGGSGSGDFPW